MGQSRLQPYLFGGALVGAHVARQTVLGTAAAVYTPPVGNEPGVINQRLKTESLAVRNFAVSLGGRFGAGVQLSKGRRASLLEVYYDMGRELSESYYLGAMQYRALGVMLGMEF
jgi:hypothetical protein